MADIYGFLIACVSLFVATMATAFTGYQAILSRSHNRKAMRPILRFTYRLRFNEGKLSFSFLLRNTGPGPAIVKNYQILFDGDTIGESNKPGPSIDSIESIIKSFEKHIDVTRTMMVDGYSISANSESEVIRTELNYDCENTIISYRDFMLKFDFKIEYSSIYDESFNTSTNFWRNARGLQ